MKHVTTMFKSISFQIMQDVKIVVKSQHNILQVIVWKFAFINQNCT